MSRARGNKLTSVEQHQKERLKAASRRLLSAPEFVVASLILLFWTVVLIPVAGIVVTLIAWGLVFGIGEGLLYLSVKQGSHGFLTVTTLYSALISGLALGVHEWATPMSLVLCGSTALFLSDLVRLNFARRRDTVLPSILVVSTLGMSAAVLLVSLLSIGLVLGLTDESGDRNWLWVPVISGLLLLVTGVATHVLSRSSARTQAGQWRPGDTMLPPPTAD